MESEFAKWERAGQLKIEVKLKRAKRDLLVARLEKIEPELKDLEMQHNQLTDELYQKIKKHNKSQTMGCSPEDFPSQKEG